MHKNFQLALFCVCITYKSNAHRGQKKASDALELELQAISHECWDDSLEEQQLLFITESSLQAQALF